MEFCYKGNHKSRKNAKKFAEESGFYELVDYHKVKEKPELDYVRSHVYPSHLAMAKYVSNMRVSKFQEWVAEKYPDLSKRPKKEVFIEAAENAGFASDIEELKQNSVIVSERIDLGRLNELFHKKERKFKQAILDDIAVAKKVLGQSVKDGNEFDGAEELSKNYPNLFSFERLVANGLKGSDFVHDIKDNPDVNVPQAVIVSPGKLEDRINEDGKPHFSKNKIDNFKKENRCDATDDAVSYCLQYLEQVDEFHKSDDSDKAIFGNSKGPDNQVKKIALFNKAKKSVAEYIPFQKKLELTYKADLIREVKIIRTLANEGQKAHMDSLLDAITRMNPNFSMIMPISERDELMQKPNKTVKQACLKGTVVKELDKNFSF